MCAPMSPLHAQTGGHIRLAIIGDVHGLWYEEDAAALQSLGADAAIFLGDFSEEDVTLIERVAAADTPKAVILGNHDAWRAALAPICDPQPDTPRHCQQLPA